MIAQPGYRVDQWAAVLDSIVAAAQIDITSVMQLVDDLQCGNLWEKYVPTGRGLGRWPKPPFHRFRDYRSNPLKMGEKHLKLFADKNVDRCQTCDGKSFGKDVKSALDYYAFYRTGEIFSWVDPIFTSGNLPVDPRNPYQPPDSPLEILWICRRCWKNFDTSTQWRFEYQLGWWNYYRRSARQDGPSRVLPDRRFKADTMFKFGESEDTPDRRHASRRQSDPIPRPVPLQPLPRIRGFH